MYRSKIDLGLRHYGLTIRTSVDRGAVFDSHSAARRAVRRSERWTIYDSSGLEMFEAGGQTWSRLQDQLGAADSAGGDRVVVRAYIEHGMHLNPAT